MFRNLLANLNMSRKERLDFVFSSPRIAELHGISLSGTSRIDPNETGTIQRFYIRLEGDCLVVSADVLEQRTKLEIIRLKFENALFRDYFYMALRDYDGTRNFSKSQKLYDATVTTMIVPRFSKSNLIEDNAKTIRVLMNTLEKEFEKVKHQFCGSPVPKADLAETDRKIRETDAAIDERIFWIYGLSKDEIALVERETVPLADYA
jgi:hypothetical protein